MPVATSYYGAGSWMGAAEEITYGTAVSPRTNFVRISAATVRKIARKVPQYALANSSTVPTSIGDNVVAFDVEGDVEFEATYNQMGLFLYHAMGATPATSGPTLSYYTHVHKLSRNVPTGLTIALQRGSDGGMEVFEGCKIAKLAIRIANGQNVMCRLTFIGETSGGPVAAGTPTFTTGIPVLSAQGSAVSFNSRSIYVRSCTYEINNNLARRPAVGSYTTLEPLRAGPVSVTMRLEAEVDDNWTAEDVAGTASDASLTLTSGSYVLALVAHNATVRDPDYNVSSSGLLMQSLTLEGHGDGTDHGGQITNINLNSSAIAN